MATIRCQAQIKRSRGKIREAPTRILRKGVEGTRWGSIGSFPGVSKKRRNIITCKIPYLPLKLHLGWIFQ